MKTGMKINLLALRLAPTRPRLGTKEESPRLERYRSNHRSNVPIEFEESP